MAGETLSKLDALFGTEADLQAEGEREKLIRLGMLQDANYLNEAAGVSRHASRAPSQAAQTTREKLDSSGFAGDKLLVEYQAAIMKIEGGDTAPIVEDEA